MKNILPFETFHLLQFVLAWSSIDIIRYVCKLPNSQPLESSFFVSKCRLIYITLDLNSCVYWIGKINIEANKVYLQYDLIYKHFVIYSLYWIILILHMLFLIEHLLSFHKIYSLLAFMWNLVALRAEKRL